MKVNMKKSDLKTGMVVEFRSGTKGMILEIEQFGTLIRHGGGWNRLSAYSDDLLDGKGLEDFDIVRIYRPRIEYQTIQQYWHEQELIWQRREPKEMTIDEISEALGYPVKIKERS